MGFHFRLESVMKYRQRIVDRQGRQVAEAQAVVTELQNRLSLLHRDLGRLMQEAPGDVAGNLKVQDLLAKTAWLEHMGQRRDDLESRLGEARRELTIQQAHLQEAWRDLEVLEQLRGRQKSAWQHAQEQREGKDLDEIGQIRADQARRSILASEREQLS